MSDLVKLLRIAADCCSDGLADDEMLAQKVLALCEQAADALERKDAVLRKAMGALLDAANCIDDMGFNSEREQAAIAAIDAELNETEGEVK